MRNRNQIEEIYQNQNYTWIPKKVFQNENINQLSQTYKNQLPKLKFTEEKDQIVQKNQKLQNQQPKLQLAQKIQKTILYCQVQLQMLEMQLLDIIEIQQNSLQKRTNLVQSYNFLFLKQCIVPLKVEIENNIEKIKKKLCQALKSLLQTNVQKNCINQYQNNLNEPRSVSRQLFQNNSNESLQEKPNLKNKIHFNMERLQRFDKTLNQNIKKVSMINQFFKEKKQEIFNLQSSNMTQVCAQNMTQVSAQKQIKKLNRQLQQKNIQINDLKKQMQLIKANRYDMNSRIIKEVEKKKSSISISNHEKMSIQQSSKLKHQSIKNYYTKNKKKSQFSSKLNHLLQPKQTNLIQYSQNKSRNTHFQVKQNLQNNRDRINSQNYGLLKSGNEFKYNIAKIVPIKSKVSQNFNHIAHKSAKISKLYKKKYHLQDFKSKKPLL